MIRERALKVLMMLALLRFALFPLRAVSAPQQPDAKPHELPAPLQGLPAATVSSNPGDGDSLLLPDGTAIPLMLEKGFSSENAKVGDVIHFAVAFEVQEGGLVVIPRRTSIGGKVVFVSRPARGARDGQVRVIYEAMTLPTGETATVRGVRKPASKGGKVAQKSADAVAGAAELFVTAGIPLLALPFLKGDERVVPEGSIEVVYLNGPVRVSRKAVTALQPSLASGDAFVYVAESFRIMRNPLKDIPVPKLFCGQRLVSNSTRWSRSFRLVLHPGNYWFSTDEKKEGSIRVDLLPDREYFIAVHRHRLVAHEIKPKKKRVYPQQLAGEDLTRLTPEEYRLLTAEPAPKERVSDSQNN
jgi:hypothetical protein